LDKIEGFDWDNANIGRIVRHAVTPFEVEEVTGGKYVVIPAKTVEREKRWKLFGKTISGRYLGCGVHHPAEALSNRDCLCNE
jgi:hypothetical protein